MTIRARTVGHLALLGVITKEDGQYVSFCPQLGVASCGDTVEEATTNLKDAVAAYVEALQETGELKGVLSERGLRVTAKSPPKSKSAPIPTGSFVALFDQEIPLALLAA